ncbi:unnamed protein product [Oikopleura dioica]|uniref:RING-type domain-containing protein n=1 Tax=Oikopleura dioica TaxID=34765 RepID=E4XKC9_OIKDI|nr:unnamed protein product [Oikopleura dioica]
MFRGFFKKKTAQLAELVTTPEKSESDSDICSICFEVWTSTGSHRVCSLKCGHLFGHSCVKTWLISSPRCPECNDHALLDDIRIIRAKTISAVDNSNETILRRELEEKIKIIKELEEVDTNRKVWTNVQTALLVFSAIFNVYMAAVYSTLVFGSKAIYSVYFGFTKIIMTILLLPFNLLAIAFYSIYTLCYWLTASFLLIWLIAIITRGFDEGTHFLFEEVRKARDEAVERARELLLH